MPRTQVQDPLSNRAPRLQPTSRPLGVGAGARPPARLQDSGVYQLAQALGEWQPVIRQLLADKVAQEQDAAVTAGELKAAELSAQQRMSEINTKFKTYVDDGTVPKSMLPFFQVGFSKRTGRELARTEFQSALDSRYKEATAVDGRVDPEAIINETLQAHREKLPQGDLYAFQGFDSVASQVAQSFRDRTNNEYRTNYERAAETKIANEGVDRLQQFVLADVDERSAKLEEFRSYFNTLKSTELPKTQTAPFIVKAVVAPMVDDLVARGDFDGAEELVQEMESFDVTGEGGLLGNMAVTKGQLAQMKMEIGERRRRADDPNETFEKKVRAGYFLGEADAKVAVVGLGEKPLDPATRQKLVSEYKEKNAGNPWAVSRYADYLDEVSRRGMTEDTPTAVATVSRLVETFDTAQLDHAAEMLSAFVQSGQISPMTELKLNEELRKRRALFGLITEEDSRTAERSIYLSERDDNSLKIIPVFASGEDYVSVALTPEQRLHHRQSTMRFYRETLATKLRNSGLSEEEAQAQLPNFRAEALKESVAYADKLTQSFTKAAQEQKAAAPAKPTASEKKPGDKPDPLAGVVTAQPTESNGDASSVDTRARAAFISFFAEMGSVNPWNRISGIAGELDAFTKNEGSFLSRATTAEERKAQEDKLRPALVYKAVKQDYYSLRKYRERGSDAGDPNYIQRLRDFATNLQSFGGAEYLTPEQLQDLGLNPKAFPSAGIRAGLIK